MTYPTCLLTLRMELLVLFFRKPLLRSLFGRPLRSTLPCMARVHHPTRLARILDRPLRSAGAGKSPVGPAPPAGSSPSCTCSPSLSFSDGSCSPVPEKRQSALPSAGSSPSVTPKTAAPAPAPGHIMVICQCDQTHHDKTYTNNTILYNPRRHAFFASPTSHRDALREPAWQSAMADEFSALCQTRTWVLIPRPPGVNVVGSKWVFKTKHKPDGSIDKHKARLMARGFTQ